MLATAIFYGCNVGFCAGYFRGCLVKVPTNMCCTFAVPGLCINTPFNTINFAECTRIVQVCHATVAFSCRKQGYCCSGQCICSVLQRICDAECTNRVQNRAGRHTRMGVRIAYSPNGALCGAVSYGTSKAGERFAGPLIEMVPTQCCNSSLWYIPQHPCCCGALHCGQSGGFGTFPEE